MVARFTAILLVSFGLGAVLSIAVGSVIAGAMVLTATAQLIFCRDARRWLPPRPVLLALGALLLTHLLATALSAPSPARWHKYGEELWLELLLVVVPVLVAGRPHLMRLAVYSLLLGGIVSALYAGFQFLTGDDPVRQRQLHQTVGFFVATGFTSHHLSYGGQAMLALVMAMAWLRHVLLGNPRSVVWPLLTCFVLGLGLVWSFARSAQLGTLAAAIYLVATLPRHWRQRGLGALALVAVLVLALPPVHKRVEEGFTDPKEMTRVNLWQSSVAGIKDRPLRGWGPANFEFLLEKHEVPGVYESRAHPHNDLLMYAVTAGLPGLAAALWLLIATLQHFHRGLRRLKDASDVDDAKPFVWIIAGAAACQIAITMAGFFQVYQTDDEPEMLLYFLVGCGLALANDSGRRRLERRPVTAEESP